MNANQVNLRLNKDSEPYIVISGLEKRFYPSPLNSFTKIVYQGLNINIRLNEVLGIVGPNAVGKTVLCNILSNELRPDAGTITIAGKPPGDVRVGYVYQNYREAMFPWLRVLDNIALGLSFVGIPKNEQRSKAKQFLNTLGVTLDLNAFPYQLSGGQQQMVALLRAMLIGPDLLIMDEPFQSLDLENRLVIQDLLIRSLKERPVTAILISHDPSEVALLANRIAVLGKMPPHVMGIIDVDLPNPRNPMETPSHPNFSRTVIEVHKLFRKALEA